MNLTINIWFLDDVCRKAGGIRCNGRDKCSDILRMMNFPHNSRYIQILYKYVAKIKLSRLSTCRKMFGSFVLCFGRIVDLLNKLFDQLN